MMAKNFGGTSCDFVRRLAYEATEERIHIIEQPGVSGTGVVKSGTRAGSFVFGLVKFASLADITTWIAAIEGNKDGGEDTAEDDNGTTYTKLITTDVRTRIPPHKVIKDDAATYHAELVVRGRVNT